MKALIYDDAVKKFFLKHDHPMPAPGPGEAVIRVKRAGVCATDIEILRGYVPGYRGVLGHEFVGVVSSCPSSPELVGQRVVGEINCNDAGFTCADALFQRNHAPGRSVLGIIARDGCLAEYTCLPAANLHVVPESLSDEEAAFTEPLAAACRILEQGLLGPQHKQQGAGDGAALDGQEQQPPQQQIAVIGDGRLGLLVSQVLAIAAPGRVTLLGRHPEKMALVAGLDASEVADDSTAGRHAAAFDLVVEATGSSSGIRTALALTRPLGTLVLKTTVSPSSPDAPNWAELANDIVVNEKVLVGSRCGPMDFALRMLQEHEALRRLLNAMVTRVYPIDQGEEAMRQAMTKGVLKVQIACD